MSADGSFALASHGAAAQSPRADGRVGLGEMFFSRTDMGGVVAAYNSVFGRMYSDHLPALLGLPIATVFHPDMPMGLVGLMMESLYSGRAVGMHIKATTQGGQWYWAFCMVQPVADGFLSIWIKPSSDMLAMVERDYDELLQMERQEGVPPEQTGKLFLERLAERGWRNYASFQSDCIHAEMQARRTGLDRPRDGRLDDLHALLTCSRSLRKEVTELESRFAGANLLTINMQVVATKLNQGRSTISEIAKNYGLMVADIQSHLKVFSTLGRSKDTFDASSEASALFRVCAAELVREAADLCRTEPDIPGIDREAELARMQAHAAQTESEAHAALAQVMRVASEMQRSVGHLRRLIVGLSIVRIACRVESGVLAKRSQGLETIVARLDALQDEIGAILDRIDEAGTEAQASLARFAQRRL